MGSLCRIERGNKVRCDDQDPVPSALWSEADGRMDPDATIRRQVLVEQARHGDGKYNGGTKGVDDGRFEICICSKCKWSMMGAQKRGNIDVLYPTKSQRFTVFNGIEILMIASSVVQVIQTERW